MENAEGQMNEPAAWIVLRVWGAESPSSLTECSYHKVSYELLQAILALLKKNALGRSETTYLSYLLYIYSASSERG